VLEPRGQPLWGRSGVTGRGISGQNHRRNSSRQRSYVTNGSLYAYRYDGGYATKSPMRLAVPRAGHWHVVVDLGGGAGHVRAFVSLLSGAAVCEYRQVVKLAQPGELKTYVVIWTRAISDRDMIHSWL